MTTLQYLRQQLETLELPITYYAFPEGVTTPLPYLIYYVEDENNFKADNSNYFETSNVIVELYTEEKDVDLENRLKEILKEYEYEASYDYISEERMYMASFSFTI